jgi:N-acetylglucosaminyldiphosphoundecaprenol N-acetyl-beta-D-mannosaminyltransferase
MKTEEILNLKIINTDYDEFMRHIRSDIENNKKSTIVAINPEKIMKLEEDERLNRFVQNAEYLIPDGVGILMASKKLGGSITNRLTGVDTMDRICRLASEHGYRIFLLGSKDEVVNAAKAGLLETYPNIRIVGVKSGYDINEDEVVKEINDSKAQILFVAMGSPSQEFWIEENRNRLNVNIFQGVGGSFDVLGDYVKRAPEWMQDRGLEWLNRLYHNPKRIVRQINLIRFYRMLRKNAKNANYPMWYRIMLNKKK